MSEPTFTVHGEDEILRRLGEISRRRASINTQFDANEREYKLLVDAERVLEAEERDLLRRLEDS